MKKYKTNGRYPSQFDFYNGAKRRQLAKDLSSRCKERREACIGSLISLKIEQPLIPTSCSSNTFDPWWLSLAAQKYFGPSLDNLYPQWLDLWQSQIFCSPRYKFLWCAQIKVFHLCIIVAHYLLNHLNDLSTCMKNILFRSLFKIVHLSRYAVIILKRHLVIRGWVRKNQPLFLWSNQPCH